jgi:hypothetical protein
MRIEVTAEDIALGCRRNGQGCPVARAIRRARPRFRFHVRKRQIAWKEHSDWIVADLPGEVVDFIFKFDERIAVEPATFDIDIPV